VRVEDLRKWAGVTSIEDRHKELLLHYCERAIISDNQTVVCFALEQIKSLFF
jgi:hypothetical protein